MGNRSSISQQGLLCPSETDLNNFQLIRPIGSGNFGRVYVCLHKGMKKEYALKVMNKRRIVRKKMGENVLRELDLLQTLSHPFICSLWYAFQDNEHIYMISDLLLGGDLAYHLKNQGRFSESRAKLLICELGLALDYLHRQRIGHFDIKPANVLLDDQGHAHLSDFGLARKLSEKELVNTFSGTRPYMAPEILLTALERREGYDWRVDWWALGVCFYELLRGRCPYEYPASFSSLQVLTIIYTRSVTMPSRWPSDLISFLRAMINPDQELRIDSFEKFRTHHYMERIHWRDVFERKMVPIFVPRPTPLNSFGETSRRGFRATISIPILGHRIGRRQPHRHHHLLLGHTRSRDQSSDGTPGGSSQRESPLLDQEVAKFSAQFRKYNRFRCEVRIVEPRLSLEPATEKQKRVMSSKTPTSSFAQSDRSGRATLQAEKMRKLFQANNRDVNYSM